ncbi:Uncharacterised protein [Photobacterium damselae]|nr:Uncharacterised protein [Photobacterium damselae]
MLQPRPPAARNRLMLFEIRLKALISLHNSFVDLFGGQIKYEYKGIYFVQWDDQNCVLIHKKSYSIQFRGLR